MRPLHTHPLRPTRAAVRLQTLQAQDRDAGRTTAEYAVGTVVLARSSALISRWPVIVIGAVGLAGTTSVLLSLPGS